MVNFLSLCRWPNDFFPNIPTPVGGGVEFPVQEQPSSPGHGFVLLSCSSSFAGENSDADQSLFILE